MKKVYLPLIQALMILGFVLFTGCGKDNPVPPEPVIDPAGTVMTDIMESKMIEIPGLGFIFWTKPNNLAFTAVLGGKVSICNLGKMSGLGNITNIPHSGYTIAERTNKEVACETGHGFVIKFEMENLLSPLFVRLYVTESLKNTSGEISGAMVKYQQPFEPTVLTVSKDFLSFTKDQGMQTIEIKTNASGWTYSCGASWINAVKNNNTLLISVQANDALARKDTVIVTLNEKRKEIIIEQAMGLSVTSAPYAIGDIYNEKGVFGIVYKVAIDGMSGMIVSVEETSCVWSTVHETAGCIHYDNGGINMNIIKNIANWRSKYPAFKWCDDFNSGGVSGWYLPSYYELEDIYRSLTEVNVTLNGIGGNQLVTDYMMGTSYWSSTERNDTDARGLIFLIGPREGFGFFEKENIYRVRAVRTF